MTLGSLSIPPISMHPGRGRVRDGRRDGFRACVISATRSAYRMLAIETVKDRTTGSAFAPVQLRGFYDHERARTVND
jgi:hypothetical protein